MKPSWDDAPEWANYLARDHDGSWWWYEHEPTLERGEWFPVKSSKFDLPHALEDVMPTLEQRPEGFSALSNSRPEELR
jgi:hypothetical protein